MIERRESRPDVIVIGCEKLQPKFFNLWFYQVLIFSFQIQKYKLYFPHCLLMGQLLKLTALLMQFLSACSEFEC